MKKTHELGWEQTLMAANTPMMLKAAMVDGLIDRGTLASGQVAGVIDDLPSCAELIARTELGTAYNAAALGSYGENGIEMIQVLDGDEDDICAPWADVTVPIDDAPDELGHPNCTRDFLPVIGSAEDYGKARTVTELVYDAEGRVVRILEGTE